MKSRKNTGSFSGKGYYIALILCAAAIGISGYLYYRNASKPDDSQLQNPTGDVGVVSPTDDDVQAVATTPSVGGSGENTKPSQTEKKPFKTIRPVSGDTISRVQPKVYNLDDPEEFALFARGDARELKVYGSDKTVTYDPQKRLGVMRSKIGASKAISIGAYTFALSELDKMKEE